MCLLKCVLITVPLVRLRLNDIALLNKSFQSYGASLRYDYDMRSHLPPDTSEHSQHTPPQPQPDRLVLYLHAP